MSKLPARFAFGAVLTLCLGLPAFAAEPPPLPPPPAGPLAPMPTGAASRTPLAPVVMGEPPAPPPLPHEVPPAPPVTASDLAPAPAIAEPTVNDAAATLALPEPPPAPPLPDSKQEAAAIAPEARPPAPPAPQAALVVGGSATVVEMPVAGVCGTCAPSCCDPCRRPSLDLQGHASWINGLEGPLSVPSGVADEVVWDSLDYGEAWGGRVAYHAPIGGWTLNIGGTYWGQWNDDDTRVGRLGASAVPGGPVTLSPVFTVGFSAESTLWGLDLDMTREVVCTPCLHAGWGLGVRYTGFDEEVRYTFTPVGGPLGGAEAEVDNRMLALQAVGYAAWSLGSRVELRARGSVFGGWLQQEVEVLRTAGLPPPGPDNEDDVLGFGAELEVEVRWRMSGGWSIGLGYGALFLADQARGEQAIGLDATASGFTQARIVEDSILAHRVFLGLSFEF